MKTRHQNPYTYPHKTRLAITDYLVDHQSYRGWNHPYRGFSPLAWNVKVYLFDETGGWKIKDHYPIDPLLDDEWGAYFKKNEWLLATAFEDAQREYIEGEYCTYPRNDQGDWKFVFGGRSGGWLILSEWKGVDFLRRFEGVFDFEDWLNGLSWTDLQIFYKAVRCMDADFTQEKASLNVSHQLNFQRHVWEEEIREKARKEVCDDP